MEVICSVEKKGDLSYMLSFESGLAVAISAENMDELLRWTGALKEE